jgi:hypothetical protein
MGLYLNGSMGFRWRDPRAEGPSGVYEKWGVTSDGAQRPLNPTVECAGGNSSEAVGDSNSVVWGWAEEDCSVAYPFLCSKPGGWRWLAGDVACGAGWLAVLTGWLAGELRLALIVALALDVSGAWCWECGYWCVVRLTLECTAVVPLGC